MDSSKENSQNNENLMNLSQKSFGHKKLSDKQKHDRFCQWLAGFIDGNGCFLVSKQGYTSLEITVHGKDQALLHQIQDKFGGSVKTRAAQKAVRYRLYNMRGIKVLCEHVNGYICHPVRLDQFQKVCNVLGVFVQTPNMETYTHMHGWFAGMFDADGTVTQNTAKKYPQLTMSVCQKYKEIPSMFVNAFGVGSLFYDKSQNGYWQWSISKKADLLFLVKYFQHFPRRSSRRQKLFQIPKICDLMDKKAHLDCCESLILKKQWKHVVFKWKNI